MVKTWNNGEHSQEWQAYHNYSIFYSRSSQKNSDQHLKNSRRHLLQCQQKSKRPALENAQGKNHCWPKRLISHLPQNIPKKFLENILWTDATKNVVFLEGLSPITSGIKLTFYKINTIPTVKHGGSCVRVLGCLAASGLGLFTVIDTTMNFAQVVLESQIYLDYAAAGSPLNGSKNQLLLRVFFPYTIWNHHSKTACRIYSDFSV